MNRSASIELLEKLNWFFHQEMHFLDHDIAKQTAKECYPEIREFTYDILWNDLPEEVRKQLMDEEKLDDINRIP